jgi:hypothetical protein
MIRTALLIAALAAGLVLAGRGPAADVKKDTKESTGKVKGNPPEGKAAPYVHVVIFTLKDGAPEGEAAALVQDAHTLLAKIPSVRRLSAGRPAAKATPVAKKGYTVGLLVVFDNAAGLYEYLEHPIHTEFVRKHSPFLDEKKLNVYDFVNQHK